MQQLYQLSWSRFKQEQQNINYKVHTHKKNSKLQLCKTCWLRIPDRDETKSNFVQNLDSSNSRQVVGIQNLTNYTTNLGAAEGDITLMEELNIFFPLFEVTSETAPLHHMAQSSVNLTVEEFEVRRHQPEEGGWSWCYPGTCAQGLWKPAGWSLHKDFQWVSGTVLHCLKSSTIFPCPRNPTFPASMTTNHLHSLCGLQLCI